MENSKPRAIPQLRHKLFKILQEQAIPQVRTEGLHSVLLANPFHIPLKDSRFRINPGEPLTETKEGRTHLAYRARWYAERMETSRSPCLAYVVEGEADMRIGITERMVQQAKGLAATSELRRSNSVTASLSKGSFLIVPCGVPHSDGNGPHWERAHPEKARSRILWVRMLPMGAFCHTCCTHSGIHDSDPALFVQDTKLSPAFDLLMEELAAGGGDAELVAQSQLITLLVRIKRALTQQTGIDDATEHLGLLTPDLAKTSGPSSKGAIVGRARAFIESNLHEPLDLHKIAAHTFISPAQLNRLFQTELQQSVMKHVAQRRLEVAKALLGRSGLSISEIGKLAGYSSASYFSQMFVRNTGMTPAEYRKLQN